MNFLDYLKPEYVISLNSNNKKNAIAELAGLAQTYHLVPQVEDLIEKLNYREELMSTGIGLGLGIPHVRYAPLKEPAVFLGLQPESIEDYESLDNEPVKILFMILVGEGEHKRHVRFLSQIVSLLKDPVLRDRLLKSESTDEAFSALKEAALG